MDTLVDLLSKGTNEGIGTDEGDNGSGCRIGSSTTSLGK